jgi:clan AA aspartic protease
MIRGHVRDYLPRVILSLPGRDGDEVSVEFTVDTAFDGDLALPSRLLSQIEATYLRQRILRLADGSTQSRPYFEIILDWHDEQRPTEIAVLENDPLLGAVLLDGCHVGIDMIDGGEAVIEPL